MALYLNNNGAVFKNPNISSDFTDISFFARIKVDDSGQYHQLWVNGHGGGFGQGYSFMLTDSGDGNVLVIDIAFVAWLESSLVINDTNEHTVGFTRRASDGVWTIYLDGSSEEVGNNTPFGTDSNSRTIVGGYNNNTTVTPEFEGDICEVGFWERLLNSTELTNLHSNNYRVNAISTTNLLVYLPMDDAFFGYNAGSGGNFSKNGTWTEATHFFTLPDTPRIVGYAENGATTGNPSVTKPSTVQSGDLLIAIVHSNGPRDITDNNGATPFTSKLGNREYNGPSAQVDIFYRVAGGSEPATYNFNLSASDRWTIGLLVIRDADTTTIWDIEPTSTTENTGTGGTQATDSITVATESLVIAFAVNDSSSVSFSALPGDSFRTPISNSGEQLMSVAYKYFGTGGTQNSIGWTQSAGNGTWLNNIFAILKVSSGTTVNSERAATVRGKQSANSSRDAKTAGKASTNSTRDAKVTGKQSTNSTRDAKTTGKNTANSERAAKTTGKQSSSSERDAKVTGKAGANSERSAKTHGKNTANSERDAKVTGKNSANAERSAKTTGIATTSSERPAKTTGKSTAQAERSAKVTGIQGANDSRSAKTHGTQNADSERLAKTTGKNTANAERSAKVSGTNTASSERPAKTTGKNTANDTRSSKTTGKATDNSERLAKTAGKNLSTDNRPAKVTGKSTQTDERAAKVVGKSSTSDTRSAKTAGKLQEQAERAAKVVGQITTGSERGAKVTGANMAADDERAAKVTGAQPTASERGAKVIGTGPWQNDNPTPFNTKGSGGFSTPNSSDWHTKDPKSVSSENNPNWKVKY